MVYGFADCNYQKIVQVLRSRQPFGEGMAQNPVKQVFDYKIADYMLRCDGVDLIQDPIKSYTVEGREIFRIKRSTSSTPHICKAALVNIIIENVKRHREGLPLIPFLFAIDISTDQSGHYPPSIDDVINIRSIYTFKELRRVYKLCADPTLPEEIMDVAQRTFKFVKVLVSTSPAATGGSSVADSAQIETTYAFETIKAPWQKDLRRWQIAITAYTEQKKIIPPEPSLEIYKREKEENGWHWRPQLLEAIDTSKYRA